MKHRFPTGATQSEPLFQRAVSQAIGVWIAAVQVKQYLIGIGLMSKVKL